LLLGFALTDASTESVFAAPASRVVENEVTGTFAPNGFIRINPTGAVTLVMPMAEMGQGAYTALSMLLAEDLEVELDQIQVQHAPANDALYANSILHIQTTGLSSSVRAFWTPLRQAGAVGRNMLIAAAAKRWGVDPATCHAKNGVVFNASGSKHLSYGDLAKAPTKLPVPPVANVKLKDPKDFTLIPSAASHGNAIWDRSLNNIATPSNWAERITSQPASRNPLSWNGSRITCRSPPTEIGASPMASAELP
jgi:isoquinoline 1-oxidoreductase beta subunit